MPPGNRVMFERLAASLFSDPEEARRFVESVDAGESKEQAIIVLDDAPGIRSFPREAAAPFQPDFVLRMKADFRPGKHPLHEKGAFYVLDLSSVFEASAMLAIPEDPKWVLDLCAAPGGKSVFAWRAFRPEVLATNESIRKRTGSLISNLHRCKVEAGTVWSADPSVWPRKLPGKFDFVIVDAPCSGQSLLAKGDAAPGCFLTSMIDMCVGRQRRILGNAALCVRPGGHLLYSTCTYSPKENERLTGWWLHAYGEEWEAVEVPHLEAYRSEYADYPCYRLFPQQGLGAGGFVALLRRKGEPVEVERDPSDIPAWWRYGDPLPWADRVSETDSQGAPSDRADKPARPSKEAKPGKGGPARQAWGSKPGGGASRSGKPGAKSGPKSGPKFGPSKDRAKQSSRRGSRRPK